MQVNRTTALAALVFVAVAAPVGAFALAGNDGEPGTSHASHPGKAKHDKGQKHDDARDQHAKGDDQADEASGPGRAHAEAMKQWARCVTDAASGPKTGERTGPPKDQCDEKPMGPGRARHLTAGNGRFAPGIGQDKPKPHGQGRGHSSH